MKNFVVFGSFNGSKAINDIETYKNEQKAVNGSYDMAKRFAQKALQNSNAESAEIVTANDHLNVNLDNKTIAQVCIKMQKALDIDYKD